MLPPSSSTKSFSTGTSVSFESGESKEHYGRNRSNRRVALLLSLWVIILFDILLNIRKTCAIFRSFRNLSQKSDADPAVIVIQWEGFTQMEHFISKYHNGYNAFCGEIDTLRNIARDASLPILVNISFGCQQLYQDAAYGTGNYISGIYGMRMASQVYENVALQLSCHDADTTKHSLILPWLTGYFPGRPSGSDNPFPNVSIDQACGEYATVPMGYMYRQLRHDMRQMAIGLVGVPGVDHPSAKFEQKDGDHGRLPYFEIARSLHRNEPVYPTGSVDLDDAVVHFRCGDLMDSENPFFAFLKFRALTKYISPEARTIGIITQPFQNGEHTRNVDGGSTVHDRCRTVVLALVDYIQARHPNSRMSIHNGPNETIALAYARMIMANETIAGVSTFGVFPVMSTFGTGTLRKAVLPGRAFPNDWTSLPRLDSLVDNLSIVDEHEPIMVSDIKKLWETQGEKGVLSWFRDDAPDQQQEALDGADMTHSDTMTQ